MSYNILIIKDNNLVYDLYAKNLIKISEANFIQKQNTQLALAHIYDSNNKVDLIITDYSMDGMNGDEFARKVKENNNTKHVPIIAITEFPEQNYTQDIFAKIICIENIKNLHNCILEILNIKR